MDKKTACKLNSGEDKLYDILVLHLEGGKDIFITVTGMSYCIYEIYVHMYITSYTHHVSFIPKYMYVMEIVWTGVFKVHTKEAVLALLWKP